MCQICEALHENIKIKHPYEYYNIVDLIKAMMQEGLLILLEGNCNFDEIVKIKPFPDDVLYHVFKCNYCDCRFSLCVDTYHGSGGGWKVLIN